MHICMRECVYVCMPLCILHYWAEYTFSTHIYILYNYMYRPANVHTGMRSITRTPMAYLNFGEMCSGTNKKS